MAYSSQVAIFILLFISSYIQLFESLQDVDQVGTIDWASRLLGFRSVDGLWAILIAIVFIFSGFFLAVLLYQAATSWNPAVLRLTHNSSLPELSLSSRKLYHLFLSHCWSSGQDQVASIKSQLELLLPGCKVFLEYASAANSPHFPLPGRVCRSLRSLRSLSSAVLLLLSAWTISTR